MSEEMVKSVDFAKILLGTNVRKIVASIRMLRIFFIYILGLFNVFNMIAELKKKGR